MVQPFASLDPPLSRLAAKRKNCDRLGGILQERLGNKDLPLGIQFIDPVHDVLGPHRRATVKESHEERGG